MALQNIKKSVPMKVNKKAVSAIGGSTASDTASKPVPKGEYVVAVGRRKVATARIRMYRGKGQSTVNGKLLNEYFSSVDPQGITFTKPLTTVGLAGAVYVTVKVDGSGMRSQADAVCHGVSRALVELDPTYKDALKKAGLLTRDPRMKESRKMGTGGKARRRKQSPKR